MECYHCLLAIKDNEWSLSLLNFTTVHDQKAHFVTSQEMCTVFLQSITVSGYIPLKEKLLGVLIF